MVTNSLNVINIDSLVKVIVRDKISFIVYLNLSDHNDLKLTLISKSRRKLYSNKKASKRGLFFNFNGFSFDLVDLLIFSNDKGDFAKVNASDILIFLSPDDFFDSDYDHYIHNEKVNVALSRSILRKDIDNNQSIYLSPYSIDSADAKKIVSKKLGASFKVCLSNNLIRFSSLKKLNIGFSKIFSKVRNAEYLLSKGFPVPEIYEKNAKLINVKQYNVCVVKPVAGTGSRGVFIKKGDVFYDVRDKKEYIGYEDFSRKFKSYTDSLVIIEEYISNNEDLLRDIKVYCFYGKTPLILEILRIGSKTLYCEYNSDGVLINTGKYKNSELFEGSGFSLDILHQAKKISELVPLPFIRVDFLVSGNLFKVGELSPTPGQYSRMSNYYDHKLGVEYIKADARIYSDLMKGKKFDFLVDGEIE